MLERQLEYCQTGFHNSNYSEFQYTFIYLINIHWLNTLDALGMLLGTVGHLKNKLDSNSQKNLVQRRERYVLFRVWSDKMLKGRERRSIKGEACEGGWRSAGRAGEGVWERSLAVMWVRLLEWTVSNWVARMREAPEWKAEFCEWLTDWWEYVAAVCSASPDTEWADCLLGSVRLSCWCDIHFLCGLSGGQGKTCSLERLSFITSWHVTYNKCLKAKESSHGYATRYSLL